MLLLIVEIILFTYIVGCVIYNLIFSLAGRLAGRAKKGLPAEKFSKIAILIPAYKEDEVIVAAAQSYLALDYPQGLYETIVIADSLQPATLTELRSLGITVIPVSFDVSTKAKSLNVAFSQLTGNYDLGLICDADNMLDRSFLLKINQAFQDGHYAMQARRVAKNIDTPFAVLDTANEIIANHIYRKGANALGLSASVIGSGMAFHFPLIKGALGEIQAIGGFDKVLQLLLVKQRQHIYYLEDALVFDEKVDNPSNFGNQRRRWLSSQFFYLKLYWKQGWQQLFKGNVDYFNLAVCQNALLPRTLLIAALTFMLCIYGVLHSFLYIPFYWWVIAMGLNIISLLLPLPAKFFRLYFFTALKGLPQAVGIMVALVFKLKGANKRFIHTRHSKTGIDNPLIDVAEK